jgi:hypothetical protein
MDSRGSLRFPTPLMNLTPTGSESGLVGDYNSPTGSLTLTDSPTSGELFCLSVRMMGFLARFD